MVRESVIENEGGREKGGESGVEDEKSKRIKNVKFMHRGVLFYIWHTVRMCLLHITARGGGANIWHAPLDCHCYIRKNKSFRTVQETNGAGERRVLVCKTVCCQQP